ncbi:MAG TPA: aldo/keto reductase [Polyangiaceae bacterium]|jgi:aryl-alcohol dehydrogenase-like predicted oxidoreductase|nr:aldo/keto reductase [Polyangiaceae bacterium]
MLRAFDSPRTLGKTGLSVSAIALGSSYGVGGRDIERAFDHGVNTFLYGSLRRPGFAKGVRALAKHREKTVIAIQTYSRVGFLMKPFVWTALRSLGTDYVDVLGLAWWNDVPSRRIWDAALALKDAGLVRHIMVSCHHRPSFESFMRHEACDAWMVRYNAGHPGAEREVFPLLGDDVGARPGVFAFTATRWGSLLKGAPNEKTPRATDCYRFALSAPRVDAVITGPKDAHELDEAIEAMQLGPMSEEELAWMKRVGAHARTMGANRGVSLLDRLNGWIFPPKRLAS